MNPFAVCLIEGSEMPTTRLRLGADSARIAEEIRRIVRQASIEAAQEAIALNSADEARANAVLLDRFESVARRVRGSLIGRTRKSRLYSK
jgi:hypothetical protein